MDDLLKFENTYTVNCQCKNCSKSAVAHIPKGETIEHFLMCMLCDNCGCFGFFKTNSKPRWDGYKPTMLDQFSKHGGDVSKWDKPGIHDSFR